MSKWTGAIGVGVLTLVGLMLVRGMQGPAPVPGVFAGGTPLAEALSRSEAEGKPVLAVVTADWCPPCQQLKKKTLVEERVAAWIGENTIPVYVDSDEEPETAQRLGVSALPTTVLLRNGQIIGSRIGYIEAEDYLAFLKSTVGG